MFGRAYGGESSAAKDRIGVRTDRLTAHANRSDVIACLRHG